MDRNTHYLGGWWVDGKVTAQSRGFQLKICPYWFFGRGFGPKAGVGSPPAFGLTVQFLLFVKTVLKQICLIRKTVKKQFII